ncbi:MAG: hypothetical protein RL213_2063 [Bacteroidota bacterium]
MEKRRIRIIIVVMTAALAGIILLQVKWLVHDFRLKDQQFDQSVNQALSDVVDRIETHEAASLLHNRLFGINPDSISEMMLTDTADADVFEIRDTLLTLQEGGFENPDKFENRDDRRQQVMLHPATPDNYLRVQRRNIIKTDSVSRRMIRSSQITRVYGDSAEIVIRQNEERIKARLSKLNEVMKKMAIEFVGSDEDVRRRLQKADLDSMLHAELRNHRIDLDFNYCVVNPSDGKILASDRESRDTSLLGSPYRVVLFPHDMVARPDYLVVSFPETFGYFLSTMGWMLVSSTLLTFIIIFGFAYTISVILRQKKISEIKSDFINNMTHEFKTPLATISLAVDSLRTPKAASDPEKFDYFTKIIREENKRMNNQVERVLQMAQIDKGEIRLNKENVDLHDLIRLSVEHMLLQVENRKGFIETDLRAHDRTVYGDPVHLSNIIINLLENANKYSPEAPEIRIETVSIPGGGILVKVSDKGVGMTKEHQKRIFEKFYRVPTGNIHNVKGFGLGLSYVDILLKEHGGWIRVSSEPGKGSTFEFHLPTVHPKAS